MSWLLFSLVIYRIEKWNIHFVNSLVPAICGSSFIAVFFILDWQLRQFLWYWSRAKELRWVNVNAGLCNGLVPSDNKPLADPVISDIYVALWCYFATIRVMSFTIKIGLLYGWRLNVAKPISNLTRPHNIFNRILPTLFAKPNLRSGPSRSGIWISRENTRWCLFWFNKIKNDFLLYIN